LVYIWYIFSVDLVYWL